jgi:hypothetical protein
LRAFISHSCSRHPSSGLRNTTLSSYLSQCNCLVGNINGVSGLARLPDEWRSKLSIIFVQKYTDCFEIRILSGVDLAMPCNGSTVSSRPPKNMWTQSFLLRDPRQTSMTIRHNCIWRTLTVHASAHD